MTVNNSGGGSGTADLDLEIAPLDQAYGIYRPFTATADPAEDELQDPDPSDGELYHSLLLVGTDFAAHTWAEVKPEVLEVLRSETLEYVSAVSMMMKIQRAGRQIQWIQYAEANGANTVGATLQIEKRVASIHTEMTKVTAVDIQYMAKYPDLGVVNRMFILGGLFAFGLTFCTEDLPHLEETYEGYQADVRNQTWTAGNDLFSGWIQQTMIDSINAVTLFIPITGIEFLEIELAPSIPIFDPNPLGWYKGGQQ